MGRFFSKTLMQFATFVFVTLLAWAYGAQLTWDQFSKDMASDGNLGAVLGIFSHLIGSGLRAAVWVPLGLLIGMFAAIVYGWFYKSLSYLIYRHRKHELLLAGRAQEVAEMTYNRQLQHERDRENHDRVMQLFFGTFTRGIGRREERAHIRQEQWIGRQELPPGSRPFKRDDMYELPQELQQGRLTRGRGYQVDPDQPPMSPYGGPQRGSPMGPEMGRRGGRGRGQGRGQVPGYPGDFGDMPMPRRGRGRRRGRR